jgi:archaellum component FlaC
VQVLDSVKIRQSGSHIAWDSTKIDLNSQMGSLSDSIAKQINTTMSTVIEQITSFSNQLDSFTGAIDTVFSQLKGFTSTISGLQNSIDSVFTSVSGSLKTNINDMVSGLTDKISDMLTGYVSTVNSYITQINNVISNVTSFISDPNSKLQPVLLYTTNGGASSYLSASKSAPTAFKLGGTGEQGAQLVATSYTGELLAPAYKKYIAVVNVTDPDGNSAQGGNATCLAAAKLANNSECLFNTVLDGGKRGVVFTTSDAYVGYTYEIAYAAVDYSGNMVARRFYVKVTK